MSYAIVIIGLVLAAALYGAGLWKESRVRRRDALWFLAGWLVLALALSPPLHEWSESRLWAHMAQHELLMIVAAPLFALARPHLVWLQLFNRTERSRAARVFYSLRVNLFVAWALHGAALWLWHLPALYEAAVQNSLTHCAQHASFFLTALLFWQAALDRRSRYGAAALYTFATALHSGALGALFFLAPHSWYRIYGAGAAALEDQQLAGLLMWVPGGVALALAALALFWRWLVAIERRARLREARGLALLLILIAAPLCAAACNDARATAVNLTGGDPDRGKDRIRAYGCWTCHTIPGIAGASGTVGPPLDKIAARAYVAGQPNTPALLMRWLRRPQEIRPATPMPDQGVSEADARDIAAYLYTLR